MQNTSDLYKILLAEPTHTKDIRVNIAGEDYLLNRIVSLSTSGGIFSTPDIGNCTSRQIDLVLIDAGYIPRQAEIRVFVRLTDGVRFSEWLQKGVFFISTRSMDKLTGKLTIHGFDSMLKASDTWLTPEYDTEIWPMSQRDAVDDIAYRMGVDVDSRTVLSNEFPVDYPIDENGDLAMVDVLEGIAICNAGNWVISDEGKLLLLRMSDILSETAPLLGRVIIGSNVSNLDLGEPAARISRVNLLVDSSHMYTAGDDTGRTIEKDLPWASQAIAESILQNLKGISYQPFEGTNALIDPAAEVGDGISVGGIYSVLAKTDISFDKMCTADISAPGGDEVDDEYPYQSRSQRKAQRALAYTRSIIAKTSESVRIAVETVNTEVQKLAEINITVDSIISRVEDAETGVSTLTQTVSGFDATVKNLQSGLSQTLRIAADGVTITNASGSKLTIDGGQLKANSISADKIDVSTLKVSKIYDSSGTKVAIDCSSSSTMYIGGNSSTSAYTELLIKGTTITLNYWGDSSKGISIHNAIPYYMRPETSNIYSLGDSSHIWSEFYTGSIAITPSGSSINGMMLNSVGIVPGSNDKMNLGSSSYKWQFLYVTRIMLNGEQLYPDRISYNSTVYASMNSTKQFLPYASTGYSIGSSSTPWATGYFTKLYIGGTEITASVTVDKLTNSTYTVSLSTTQALTPGGNNTYTLGSSSYYWKTAYITTLYLSSTCYISAGSATTIKVGTTTIGSGTSSIVNGSYSVSLSTSGVLTPKSSNTYNLGSSSYYWKYIYAQRVYLQYSAYASIYLSCNSSNKLCVNGTAIH